MRRLAIVMLLGVAMLATPLSGMVVTGQEASPPAAEVMLPEGVTAEPLAAVATEAIQPTPVLMELVRFTFEPGAMIRLPEESPSTALVYVESGVLTARVAAPVTVTRSTVGGQQETFDAGTEFTAGTGDFFIGPAHVAVEARNDGTDPLVLLMAVIEPAAGDVGTPAP